METTELIMEEVKEDIFIDDKLKEVLDKVIDEVSEPNGSAIVTVTTEINCANPRCKNTFIAATSRHRFCSEPCRLRNNSLVRYNQVKDNQEYKDKVHQKNKRYYEENKEKLRAQMKAYGKEYYKKKKEKKKDGNSDQNKETI